MRWLVSRGRARRVAARHAIEMGKKGEREKDGWQTDGQRGTKRRERGGEREGESTRFLGESAICARSLGSSLTGVVCAAHERAQPVRCVLLHGLGAT